MKCKENCMKKIRAQKCEKEIQCRLADDAKNDKKGNDDKFHKFHIQFIGNSIDWLSCVFRSIFFFVEIL